MCYTGCHTEVEQRAGCKVTVQGRLDKCSISSSLEIQGVPFSDRCQSRRQGFVLKLEARAEHSLSDLAVRVPCPALSGGNGGHS